MRHRYPRVVFEGTRKHDARRFRIVEMTCGVYLAEERFRDALNKPRWEPLDLEKHSAREVVRIFGGIASAKRARHFRR